MSRSVSRKDSQPSPRPESDLAEAAASSRATWSGLLRVSLVTLPVKGYPGTVSATESHFHQLHADCGQRVRHQKHCPLHGPLDAGAIVKGYEYALGQHIVLDEEQLDRLRPAKDRAACLEHFINPADFDPSLISGRSLYLVPDGPGARTTYSVLLRAMVEHGKWAVGPVGLSGQRRPALIRPSGRLLMLHVLHYPRQVRAGPTLEIDAQAASSDELELAGQLIRSYSRPVSWSSYRDDSAEQLAAYVEAELAGRAPTQAAEEEVPVLRLLDALKQSVAAAVGESSVPVNEATPPSRRRKRAISRRIA